ncbi:hypothetical protein T484DRAFT_1754634 [Baffinella frigidus]|nr:hypothetical protein T484DRAFT_1754634 [Cryptophyta sp. CCMP2293]
MMGSWAARQCNLSPVHCQPTPYPLPTNALSTANRGPIQLTDALSTANRRPILCQPTPHPANPRPIQPTDALSSQLPPYSLATDAFSTANRRPFHCQLPPYHCQLLPYPANCRPILDSNMRTLNPNAGGRDGGCYNFTHPTSSNAS